MKKILAFAFFVLISFSAGFLGTLLSGNQSFVVYQTLNLPSFSPPGWIFGPAWSLLYLLMGIAVFLIWQERKNINTKINTIKRTGTIIVIVFCLLLLTPGFGAKSLFLIRSKVCCQGICLAVFMAAPALGCLAGAAFGGSSTGS